MLSAEHTCDSDRVFALPYFDFLELLSVRVCVCIFSSVSTVGLDRIAWVEMKCIYTLSVCGVIGCQLSSQYKVLHV